MHTILAIDPGTAKCGIAIVAHSDGVLARAVVNITEVSDKVQIFLTQYNPDVLIIGSGTGSHAVIESLGETAVPLCIVEEKLSTQSARDRYFCDNPPKGWRRLIPRGLLVPNEPYDDYAAVILAEAYLKDR